MVADPLLSISLHLMDRFIDWFQSSGITVAPRSTGAKSWFCRAGLRKIRTYIDMKRSKAIFSVIIMAKHYL